MDSSSQYCEQLLRQTESRWHLVGIGGIGVSAIARILIGMGHDVRGSDVRESQLTLALREEGADVRIGHAAAHLDGVDIVVASTAIPKTNVELVAAAEKGIPIVHRSHLLGAIIQQFSTAIGITGTHGKGTVSSSIAHILHATDQDPSFLIGGLLLNHGTNAYLGKSPILVAEVDESDGSHENVQPTHAVLNQLEMDHLNYYDSWSKLEDSMVGFSANNPRLQRFYVNLADPGIQKILPRLQSEGVSVRSYGLEYDQADIWACQLEPRRLPNGHLGGAMTVMQGEEELGRVEVQLPGRYNLSNMLAAITVCLDLGLEFDQIRSALQGFLGLENRFTVVEAGSKFVVKDYISHPTGIRRVLEGASYFKKRPIVAVFKPYRFTMINYLQDDYRDAFTGADHVLITELYTAGEVPIPGIDTEFLCNKIRESGTKVTFVPEMNDIKEHLHTHHAGDGMVLFFGGDDLFTVADGYADELGGVDHS